jgi:hypothetical protein
MNVLTEPILLDPDRIKTVPIYDRDKDSFRHALEINRAWGQLEQVLDWCKSECQSEWRWQLIESSTDLRPGRYVFYFDSERDFCAFVLKWS